MRLDLWISSYIVSGEPVEDESKAFTGSFTKVFLVENQPEYDIVYALQFMYGAEVTIQIWPRCGVEDILSLCRDYQAVFTTWDPFDRNRI